MTEYNDQSDKDREIALMLYSQIKRRERIL